MIPTLSVSGEPLTFEFLPLYDKQTEPLDAPLVYITFPVEKTIQATFSYVGELQPMPVPDLDD